MDITAKDAMAEIGGLTMENKALQRAVVERDQKIQYLEEHSFNQEMEIRRLRDEIIANSEKVKQAQALEVENQRLEHDLRKAEKELTDHKVKKLEADFDATTDTQPGQ